MSDISVSSYSAITKSGQTTFTGLGNGTDFNQLIAKLVAVEQTRITKLQTWRQSWTKKQTAFDELSTALTELQTTLESLDTLGEFMAKTITSSDSTVLTATAGTGADNGSHVIEVKQLAAAKTMVTSTGYSSKTSDINVSNADVTFSYVYKGVTYTNTIGANCTLDDLVNIINNDANNAGVKASVVNDGSLYYLKLAGTDTGADASLIIASNSALTGFSNADFGVVTSNCDALLKLDGWPSSYYLTRSSNKVTDLVDGVTLNLASTGSTTLTTTTDTDTIKSNIQTFVKEMNTVRTLLQELTKVDTSSNTASVLTGNYGVQLIQSRLATVVATIGVGFDYNDDTYSVLSQLGITTDAEEGSSTEGLLVIDDDTLDSILASNADAVAKLFAANYAGSTSSSELAISSYISGTTECGTYQVSYTTDASGKITAATINGHPALFHSNSNIITGQHGYDEAGLSINCIDVTAGTHTGTVNLRKGKSGELVDVLDELIDPMNGPLVILDKNYDDIVSMIDDKISFEKTRISNYSKRLRTKFAKVDALLGTYNNQQTALSSYIDKLNSD
ncbi:MAG: flagellar filament capping protein FliD [Desulfovibrionaceae bacterium]